MSALALRVAEASDAAALRDVYAPYVEDTVLTFETTVPSVEEFRERVTDALETHPWLVCERDGEVVGYACAGEFRSQGAFRWTAETSVFLAEPARGRGIGTALYGTLLDLLAVQGYVDAYAGVTVPNPASAALHESLGFEAESTSENVGYKHGAWHDVRWWRRELRERPDEPAEPLALAEAMNTAAWERAMEAGREKL